MPSLFVLWRLTVRIALKFGNQIASVYFLSDFKKTSSIEMIPLIKHLKFAANLTVKVRLVAKS